VTNTTEMSNSLWGLIITGIKKYGRSPESKRPCHDRRPSY
jgi:hypothetical protein